MIDEHLVAARLDAVDEEAAERVGDAEPVRPVELDRGADQRLAVNAVDGDALQIRGRRPHRARWRLQAPSRRPCPGWRGGWLRRRRNRRARLLRSDLGTRRRSLGREWMREQQRTQRGGDERCRSHCLNIGRKRSLDGLYPRFTGRVPPWGGMLPDSLGSTFCMEHSMGHKPSNNFQSNRPESGGANHDMSREKSGLTERDKELFASEQAKRESAPARSACHRHAVHDRQRAEQRPRRGIAGALAIGGLPAPLE